MIKEGVVEILCKNMKEMLRNLPRDTNCDKSSMRVGFMTYDSKINFYNCNSKLAQPQQVKYVFTEKCMQEKYEELRSDQTLTEHTLLVDDGGRRRRHVCSFV